MRREKYAKQKREEQLVALERVRYLFGQAEKVAGKDPLLAKKYIALARRIAMRHRARIPAVLKRRFCKHCGAFWVQGANVRVRTHRGKLVYFCTECRHFTRIGYGKKKAR